MENSGLPVGRWRHASMYWNTGRRFNRLFSNPVAKASDDDEHKDLEKGEKNTTPVQPPPARALVGPPARSSPVNNPIKGIVNHLVRSAVINGTPQDQLQEQQKRCSKYSQKALVFQMTTFVAYLGSSGSSSTGNTPFKITMAAFFVAIPVDLISVIMRTSKLGCTLVYLSWFLLVLLSYLLLVSFHKDYSYAIIPVLFMFFVAVLQLKLRPSVRQQNTTNTKSAAEHLDSDDGDQDLENIFEWSASVVNCGGLVSMILGHYMYMVGPNHLTQVSTIGFLFFFTVVLGLYLMMVTTVRTTSLILYIRYIACLLNVLLVGTLIATVIHGVWISRN